MCFIDSGTEKTFHKYVLALQLGQLLCVPSPILVTMTILAGPEMKIAITMRFHLLLTNKGKEKRKKKTNTNVF